ATCAFMVDAADARVGGGGSIGSRGARTYTSPPSTNTGPKAAPVDRSMTQPGSPSAAQGVNRPTTAAAPSRFGGGFGGMLMGALLGAGLFGLLSVHALCGCLIVPTAL